METLRTPAHRFDDVPGFDRPVDRVELPDGDGHGPTVVCRHGEPTFSNADPVTAGAERALIRDIAGAALDRNVTLGGGGHLLQEDVPSEMPAVVTATVASTT